MKNIICEYPFILGGKGQITSQDSSTEILVRSSLNSAGGLRDFLEYKGT
jgi:hypothetical protein